MSDSIKRYPHFDTYLKDKCPAEEGLDEAIITIAKNLNQYGWTRENLVRCYVDVKDATDKTTANHFNSWCFGLADMVNQGYQPMFY